MIWEGDMKDSKDWLAAVARQAGEQLAGETFVAACPLASRGFIRRAAGATTGFTAAKTTPNAINGALASAIASRES